MKNRIGMTRPLRILLVANADRRRAQGRWYGVEYKLFNGFVRLGHMPLFFSDRDAARELSLLPTKKLGITRMNQRLIETAKHFLPDLVLFGHADLCSAETFEALRSKVQGIRLAQFCVDSTSRGKTMGAFAGRAQHMDVSFLTTADRSAVAALNVPEGTLFYLPNPTDPAIETARVFDQPRDAIHYDGLFLGTGIEKRGEQLDFLAQNLAKDVRFHYGGRAKGEDPLVSTAFLEALTEGAMGPCLPLDDTVPVPYLYSSDRIAQLLGQGVATLVPASAGFSNLYEDGIVEWENRAALVEAMTRLSRDDAERRRIAETGWRLAHEHTSSTEVAAYVIEIAMERARAVRRWPIDALR